MDDICLEANGFVDKIESDIAYLTIKSKDGDELWCEYPAAELIKLGIHERRRFKCQIIIIGEDSVQIEKFEAVPDNVLTDEQVKAINDRLDQQFGSDDTPQDDY